MHGIRRNFMLGVAVIATMIAVAACSSSPNSHARACNAKTQLQASLNDFRAFDFTNPNASKLADIADSMSNQLKNVEGAVHLPQSTQLRQLGGVGHLRQLERELSQSAQQLRNAHASNEEQVVFTVRPALTTQAAQVQQVADAVTGC